MPEIDSTQQSSGIPQYCTCGARLPDDARFCHKCGKPQREELVVVEQEAAPPPPVPAAAEPPPIGFHNRIAVRVAMLTGILGFLLSAVSGAFALLWMVVVGFLAVYLYHRRTGQRLSVISGAHLGWITGLFGFVIATILVTFAAVAISQPEVVNTLRQQWKTYARPEADINQMIELLRNPSSLIVLLLVSFFSFTILPAFGGAIGAKLLDRN